MRRSRPTNNDGLELLLDTVTNTFGCVLLLAIILSQLATSSARESQRLPPTDPTTQVILASYQVRINNLRSKLHRIESQRNIRYDSTSHGSPQSALNRSERDSLTRELSGVLEQQARVAVATAEANALYAKAAEENAAINTRSEDASRQLQLARQDRESSQSLRKQLSQRQEELVLLYQEPETIEHTVRTLELKDSPKRSIAILLRFGRCYMMHSWQDGRRLGPNSQDFVVTPGPPQKAFPKPSGGFEIASSSVHSQLQNLLRRFSPDRWRIDVILFDDSFTEFQILKSALIDMNYEYYPMAVRPGDQVFDYGGRSSKAQ